MSAPIEYFYSTHSAYAYLGSSLFRRICNESNRSIRHVPFDLRRLISASGHAATGSLTEQRRRYFFGREIFRWSEYRDAPVVSAKPTWHDHDLTRSSTLVIAAQLQGIDVGDLTHALLTAHWEHDADLDDHDSLIRIADSVGLNGTDLAQIAKGDATATQYEKNTNEAIERGIFGSPTYIVDGDVFYGQDRLALVERAIDTPFQRR